MPLAVRPEGVSPKELGEPSTSEVTKTCKLIAAAGLGSWKRLSHCDSMLWVTPEQYATWLVMSSRKPKPAPKPKPPASHLRADGTPKDPKRIAAALKGRQPKPTLIVAPNGAKWDRSAPAVITSATRVTIWQPRTRAEWIADVTA